MAEMSVVDGSQVLGTAHCCVTAVVMSWSPLTITFVFLWSFVSRPRGQSLRVLICAVSGINRAWWALQNGLTGRVELGGEWVR